LSYTAKDFSEHQKDVDTKFVHICSAISTCVFLAPAAYGATIPLDPTASFLRTENDLGATLAPAIQLSDLGVSAGDQVRLEGVGSYDRGGGFGEFFDLIGLFSSSNTLLPSNLLNRVPGAIDAGTDISTLPTNFGGSPTDIPEDFWISLFDGSVRDGEITIPNGALFLFLGTADSYFEDNVSLGGWALEINKVAAVPLPPALPLMALGLAGIAMLGRTKKS